MMLGSHTTGQVATKGRCAPGVIPCCTMENSFTGTMLCRSVKGVKMMSQTSCFCTLSVINNSIMSSLNCPLGRLEPDAVKVARPVLRGGVMVTCAPYPTAGSLVLPKT